MVFIVNKKKTVQYLHLTNGVEWVAHGIFWEEGSKKFDTRSHVTIQNLSHDDESHGIMEDTRFQGDD